MCGLLRMGWPFSYPRHFWPVTGTHEDLVVRPYDDLHGQRVDSSKFSQTDETRSHGNKSLQLDNHVSRSLFFSQSL